MTNTYDNVVGYSSLDRVDLRKLQRLIDINKTIIDEYYAAKKGDLILVAGAGYGVEAKLVHEAFRLRTIGIDLNINPRLLPASSDDLYFQKQDMAYLAFPEKVFALIYCYHVLEHVDDYKKVLTELHRVLSPGGVLFIGFPNKNRLFSYFGSSQEASILEKIHWNIIDYRHRVRGTFDNEHGAHAGFTEKEFLLDSSNIFPTVFPIRNLYMLSKYSKFDRWIGLIIRCNLAEIIFPSNYYICVKE